MFADAVVNTGLGHIIAGILIGLIVGALVAFAGTLLDPSADNRYAKIAGFVVFLLVVLAYLGIA